MATKKKAPSKNRSSHAKRVAKAAPKSAAEKQARLDAQRAEQKKEEKKKQTSAMGKKIAAIVFSVLLILAFAIPSVAGLLSGSGGAKAADEAFNERVSQALAEIEADTSGTIGYQNLGDIYFDWAEDVMSGEVESEHAATEIYGLAIESYQKFLADNEGVGAQLKLAQAQLAVGSTTQAAQTLQAVIAADAGNAEAWARIGDVYAAVNDAKDATTAYNKAAELDADGTGGWKAYSEQALARLTATQ